MIYYKHCVDMAHMYKKAIVKMPDGESNGDIADFPNFKVGTMYTGMEVDKYYTLEELGL